MNKFLNRLLSAGLAVCMLPAFGGGDGVKAAPASSYSYDFDKTSDYDAAKKVFYEKYQENGTDIWHSALEHSLTKTDVFGDTTGAVNLKWNKYDAIGKNDKGADSFIRFSNPDYSGKAYTSFDFMLDNADSSVWVYDRVPVSSSNKPLNFMRASVSSLQLLEQTVDAQIVPGTWYHVSIVTEYDGDKTVTGSAWLNGEKVVTDASKVYTQKPDCIDGSTNGANYLTFVSYYSSAGETGAWFDNINFNQAANMNINTGMTAAPVNGSVIDDGDFEFVFGADVDKTDFSPEDITITKNGTAITPEKVQLEANKLKIKLAAADITHTSSYEITLPALNDVLGNELSEESRSFAYETAPYVPLKLISPRDGGYIEKGSKIVIAVESEDDVDEVSFWVNGEKIADGTKDGGLWKCEWEAKRYGESTITAKYGEYEVSSDIKVMKGSVQSGVWALSGSNLDGVPEYSGDDGRTPAYPMSGSRAVDSYSASEPKITVVKGGIYSLEADVYTDSNGDGVIPALSTAPNAMTNSVNMFVIQGGDLLSKRSGDVWGEGVFGKNEWHTFKAVIDMTGGENVYDVYVDGVQYADDIAFSNSNFTERVGRIKIQLTTQSAGEVFLDNVRLVTLTESSGVYVFSASPAEGSYVEAGDEVVLTAKLVDDSDEPVEFESASFYINGEYAGEGEKLDGSDYGLKWTPETGGKALIRIEATADDQDFEKEFELEVFDLYHKESVKTRTLIPNTGRIVLTSDTESDATSSNAADTSVGVSMIGFKEQGSDSGSSSYVQINAGSITKGFVVYEFDIHFADTEQGIRVYNRPSDTNVPDTAINFVKGAVLYGDENSTTVDSGYTYEANKWYNVKIVWNVDAGTKDLYLDGVQIVNGAPIKFSPGRNISQVRTEISNLWKSAGSADIQNETLRFASVAPKAEKIAAYDADGKSLDTANLDAKKAQTITVTYSQSLLARNINSENVKLWRGFDKQTEVTDVTVSADGENGIKLELGENALEASSQYVLTLDGISNSFGAVSDSAQFEIRTSADGKGVYLPSFTSDGRELSGISELSEGNTVTFKAKAISPEAGKCYAVITVNAASDGSNELKAMVVTPITFAEADKETDLSASLKLDFTPGEGDVIRAFVWDENTLPFGDEFILN